MDASAPGSTSHEAPDFDDDNSDDGEMDWEEVVVPASRSPLVDNMPPEQEVLVHYGNEAPQDSEPSGTAGIEITIQSAKKVNPERKKQAEHVAKLRALRLTCHKIHTIALLSNALVRSRWLNNQILQARLLSLTPLSIQTSFAMITKKRHPDAAKRGRLFETTLMRLTEWWCETFSIDPYGHIYSRTFDQVQNILLGLTEEEIHGELVKNSKSLMKHAVNRRGSRDVSAQLFTALCRSLGLPARLVVSIQSVPWQAHVGKPKVAGKKKGKGKAAMSNVADTADQDEESDDDMEEVSIPSPPTTPATPDRKGKGRARFPGDGNTLSGTSTPSPNGKDKAFPKPVIRLRKAKPTGQRLGSTAKQTPPPLGGYPPVFWTEVFSRPDGRWMPVDPIRNLVNKRKVFQPPAHDTTNRMVYVVAVEEDGFCRDVTPRYARDYGAKIAKVQLAGRTRRDWWECVMRAVTRPFGLLRDDVEDDEFESYKHIEGMPTSIAGFKDHPLYVLEQHLKRDEVISPKTEMGKFRGEPVYSRLNVIPLKTAENWIHVGRQVKEGAQAMKWVKQRAVTINRRRAMELAQQEGDEMLQGLYAEAQTELYTPDPVIDGKVPKNDFGNIDLYTPSMLPAGAVHIPYKGITKIARKLGFDFAEAVTSFEFKKGRAFPVLTGIVTAAENEAPLLEAYWEAENEAAEKARKKAHERAMKRWVRLIHGLRIRARLQAQYADRGTADPASGAPMSEAHAVNQNTDEGQEPAEKPVETGGFLLGSGGSGITGSGAADPDTIVQPFHLPRFEHGTYQPDVDANRKAAKVGAGAGANSEAALDFTAIGQLGAATELTAADPLRHAYGLPAGEGRGGEGEEGEDLNEMVFVTGSAGADGAKENINTNGASAPKSMQELAEEMAAKRLQNTSLATPTPSAKAGPFTRRNRSTAPGGIQPQEQQQTSKALRRTTRANGITSSKRGTPTRSVGNHIRKEGRAASTADNGRRARRGKGNQRKRYEDTEDSNIEEDSEDSEDKDLRLDSDSDESSGLSEPPDTDNMSIEDGYGVEGEPAQNNDRQDDMSDVQGNVAQPQPQKQRSRRGQKRKRTTGTVTVSIQGNSDSQVSNAAIIPATGTSSEAPPTGRVLRPRAPKTAAKLQAEREAERAFRRAIAE